MLLINFNRCSRLIKLWPFAKVNEGYTPSYIIRLGLIFSTLSVCSFGMTYLCGRIGKSDTPQGNVRYM